MTRGLCWKRIKVSTCPAPTVSGQICFFFTINFIQSVDLTQAVPIRMDAPLAWAEGKWTSVLVLEDIVENPMYCIQLLEWSSWKVNKAACTVCPAIRPSIIQRSVAPVLVPGRKLHRKNKSQSLHWDVGEVEVPGLKIWTWVQLWSWFWIEIYPFSMALQYDNKTAVWEWAWLRPLFGLAGLLTNSGETT